MNIHEWQPAYFTKAINGVGPGLVMRRTNSFQDWIVRYPTEEEAKSLAGREDIPTFPIREELYEHDPEDDEVLFPLIYSGREDHHA